ncbi:MarR family winged helix-turn-helix transcriptional regulator [Marisediminicola sp. LYQ85]|uniref:MarR family winged helix-turn-helix transcriptional regulator n=1 Tax=Marisediminicola sp. LYQ85 TaxID=3391062 RepID=UPI003983DAA5
MADFIADQRPIGYWLKLVDRMIDERFDSTIDEHGVTRRQWQVLNVLSVGTTTRDELFVAIEPFLPARTRAADIRPPVADGLDEAAPVEPVDADGLTVSSEVDELIESEWVADSPSGLVLTPTGRAAFERIADVVAGIRASVTEGVGDDDYATTVRSLERMAANLGWRG